MKSIWKYKKEIAYLLTCIGALVWISFYGGFIPYMTFFLIIWNAVVSFLYIGYVYSHIRIHQNISSVKNEKGVPVLYRLVLENEGFVPMENIKLHFYRDTSRFTDGFEALEQNRGLDIKQKCSMESKLIPLYCGSYETGVESVEIWDYFHIFSYHFPVPQTMRLIVRPTILPWQYGEHLNQKQDEKKSTYIFGEPTENMDPQVHPYTGQEPMQMIHWKNSAKRMEWMVKQRSPRETVRNFVLMEGDLKNIDSSIRYQVIDKLLEANIAIVNDFLQKQCEIEAVFGGKESWIVRNEKEFEQYIDEISEFLFGGDSLLTTLEKILDRAEGVIDIILLSVDISDEIMDLLQNRREQIGQVYIYTVLDRLEEKDISYIADMYDLEWSSLC